MRTSYRSSNEHFLSQLKQKDDEIRKHKEESSPLKQKLLKALSEQKQLLDEQRKKEQLS